MAEPTPAGPCSSSSSSFQIRRRVWGQGHQKQVQGSLSLDVIGGIPFDDDVEEEEEILKTCGNVEESEPRDVDTITDTDAGMEPHPPQMVTATAPHLHQRQTEPRPRLHASRPTLHQNVKVKTERSEDADDEECVDDGKYYTVMYAKPSTRKRKVWEGDGFLVAKGNDVTLKDAAGQVLEMRKRFKLTQEMISDAKIFSVGSKEVQVVDEVSHDESVRQQEDQVVGVGNANADANMDEDVQVQEDNRYFTAMYANPSTRKHKIWEGDGFIVASNGNNVTLTDSTGHVVDTRQRFKLTQELSDGKVFVLGSKEIQILDELDETAFRRQVQQQLSVDGAVGPQISAAGSDDEAQEEVQNVPVNRRFSVMYAKSSTRKHKKWEDDGFVIAKGNSLTLQDSSHGILDIRNGFKLTQEMIDGKVFQLGSKEVQIVDELETTY